MEKEKQLLDSVLQEAINILTGLLGDHENLGFPVNAGQSAIAVLEKVALDRDRLREENGKLREMLKRTLSCLHTPSVLADTFSLAQLGQELKAALSETESQEK